MIFGLPPGRSFCFSCNATVYEPHHCPSQRVIIIPYETWWEEASRIRWERELLFLRKWVYGTGPLPPQPLQPCLVANPFLSWIARALLNGKKS